MNNSASELQRLELELYQRILARKNLSDFIPYLRGGRYHQHWFHLIIAQQLQKVYEREIKKLMLFVPPQHGKSEISTRSFPAWVMGRNPETQLVVCSYSADLASSFNRDIQVRMDSPQYLALFPNTRLNASNLVTTARGGSIRNSAVFGIVGHEGLVRTVGVGGGITGKPVDVGIIDDPIKGRQEAQSPTTRDYVWNWYVNDFETRLHNDSVQVLIMTRWHQDDPAGRALERDGLWSPENPFGWHVIKFPALRTSDINDFDPRAVGQALWPEKHSQAKIEKVQKDNPITFNSLYQQDPKPSPEALVYPNWSTCPVFPPHCDRMVFGLDFGFSNHPSALVKIGQVRNQLYLDEWLYKTGLNSKVLAQQLRQLGVRYTDTIVADSAQPGTISDLREEGFTVVRAIKGPGSVNAGIDTMRSFEIFVTQRSQNLQKELRHYEWIMEGGYATNEPIDAFNHALDASRYGARFLRMHSDGGIEQY